MKFKTTKKAIKNGYHRIIGVGYCSMQYLLTHENARAYSTRAEGWACDYYDIDGICISTGYAPMPCKNTHVDYAILEKYEQFARQVAGSEFDLETKISTVRQLLREFILACTSE
jgi:hypothetical protein